jgi:hypothetical protein
LTKIWTKMSSIQDMMASAFMAGMNYSRMMMSQMPQLRRQDTFAPGSCGGGAPCVGAEEERQPQEDEGERITDEEVTELRFELHELYDARFVEALDDEDVRNLVSQYMKDTGGADTDALVRTLESKHRITIKGEPIEAAASVTTMVSTDNTNPNPSTVVDQLREESWEGTWGDAVTDEITTRPAPAVVPTPSSNGAERTVALLQAIFDQSAAAAPAPAPAPEPAPVALVQVAAPVSTPVHAHPIFGRNAFAWCRAQTGPDFVALNKRFKDWWSVKRPARLMYCGAKRPMIPENPAYGEFKYFIDNLPTGELSLHDIREMIAATGIPVLDVFRPVYPDPATGRMVAGRNIKVTVARQFNGVSAEQALALLQAAPVNFRGAALHIQRFRGY